MLRGLLIIVLAALAASLALPPLTAPGAESVIDASTRDVALADTGLTLTMPADWQALDRPPPGTAAAWRAADGGAAVSLVTRTLPTDTDAEAWFTEQRDSLVRHASELDGPLVDDIDLAGRRWRRLRFALRIGERRWFHVLLLTLHDADGGQRALALDLASDDATRSRQLEEALSTLR